MSKFKVLKWIRDVRDKDYKETENLTKRELLEYYKKKTKKSNKQVSFRGRSLTF